VWLNRKNKGYHPVTVRTLYVLGCLNAYLKRKEYFVKSTVGGRDGGHSRKILRHIVGCRRQGVAGGWRRMRFEDLHAVTYLLNIFRIVKSRKMRWARRVARLMEDYVFVGKPE
jgi:hypothetical protein